MYQHKVGFSHRVGRGGRAWPGEWLKQFRDVHGRAKQGLLGTREGADYRAARDELARTLLAVLNTKAAAAALGISTKTLYQRVKAGRITCIEDDGGGKRFRPSDLKSYIEVRVRSPERADRLARCARR